jgi:hypothetical protein
MDCISAANPVFVVFHLGWLHGCNEHFRGLDLKNEELGSMMNSFLPVETH